MTSGTVFMLEDATPGTLSLGYLVNLASDKCWMANATSGTTIWYPHCVMRTPQSPSNQLRGVFQTLTTKGLGGPLYNVVWDDPACVCGSGPCPVSTSITGLDGHGIGAVGLGELFRAGRSKRGRRPTCPSPPHARASLLTVPLPLYSVSQRQHNDPVRGVRLHVVHACWFWGVRWPCRHGSSAH